MSYALVGTAGSVVQGAGAASVTPAFGSGESRTAGNLLILWVTGKGANTLPSAPTGWSTAVQKAGTSESASIFYKIAAGSDSNPVVAGVTGVNLSARVAEFSGNASSSVLDQTGTASGATSPLVAAGGAADAQSGELLIYAAMPAYSASTANSAGAGTLNNGASATEVNNNGTTNQNHYAYGYGITTGNSSASQVSYAFTTTNITDTAVAVASFALPSSGTISGSGSGSFAFGGTGTGLVKYTGTGSGSYAFSGTGTGSDGASLNGMAKLTGLKIEIELGSTWTDITAYVTHANTNRGRSRQTDMYQAGSASITVRNDDRRFDPANTASPYSPYLLPRLPIRVTVATNVVFSGWVDDLDLEFDSNTTSDVIFTCSDAFSAAANLSLVNYSAAQEKSGTRITNILSTTSYIGATSIATGLQTLQAGTISGYALDALQTAARSENGYLFAGRGGTLTFYDRHHLTNVTPGLQFSDQAGTAIRYQTVKMQTSSSLLYNQVIGQRTGGTQQEANSVSSQVEYLTRSLSLGDLECLQDSDVADVCSYVLGRFAQPQVRFASMTVNLLRLSTAQQDEVTALDLTSLLTVTRKPPGTGTPSTLTKDCMIDGIAFQLSASPPVATMTLTLADLDERNFFVLDSSIFGVLDTSLLDY